MKPEGLALCVVSLALCLSCSRELAQKRGEDRAVNKTVEAVSARQSGQTDVEVLISRLSSDDEADRVQAEARLVEISQSSPNARQQVVDGFTKSLARPNLSQEILHSRKMFLLWTSAAKILGTIKAEEALDLLIGCLYCNDGEASSSASAYPALRAVIRIGPSAVPKLSAAVWASQDPYTRQYAARALSSIGGKDAEAALDKASLTEKDKSVATQIKLSLAAMKRAQQKSIKLGP